jgi:hypothetical protein
MSSMPWMFQSHITDAKIRRFEIALQAIAGLDWNAMTSDQALANLRDAITIARVALERQGRPELAIGCVGPRTSYKTSLPGPSPKAVRGG